MTLVTVRAAEGRVIKDANGRVAKGAWSIDPHDRFWAPLLANGDLVRVDPAPTAPLAAPSSGKEPGK